MPPLKDVRGLRNRIFIPAFQLRHRHKERFECPICGYRGPFKDLPASTGMRKHAQCPNCKALERQRIQYVVAQRILKGARPAEQTMLHVAPEPVFRDYFRQQFGRYETADMNMKGVDHKVDLQQLPFEDESYDFVFASHVLEHIADDNKAISEIRRILRPKGIAVLPVPVIAEKTIEYPEPNPHEGYHVRAPGMDYFERYKGRFSRVEIFRSDSLPERYQLYICEDRSLWPSRKCPLRPSMPGDKHVDMVPVCYV